MKDYTILTGVASILTAVLGYFTFFYKKSEKPKIKEKTFYLQNHSVFSKLVIMRQMVEYNFIIENEKTRENVIKDLLINKIDIALKHLNKLVIDVEMLCDGKCSHPNNELLKLKELNEKCFEDFMYEFNNYYKNGNYTEEEIKCLDYAVKKFNNIHFPAVNSISRTNSIITTEFTFTNCLKEMQTLILYAWLNGFTMSLVDSMELIRGINGYFDNKKFKERKY